MAGKPLPSLRDVVGTKQQPGRVTSRGQLPSLQDVAPGLAGGGLPSLKDLVANKPGAPTKGGGGHKGGGGILGTLEGGAHWIAGKAGLAAHDVKTIPGGIVQMTHDEYGALKQSIEHPWVSGTHDPNYVGNTKAGRKVSADVKGMAHGAVTSVEHPLRDPFQTALTVLPIVSGAGAVAARAGAVGRVASEGGSVADLAKAAVRKPEVKPRLIRVGDEQLPLQPSKNPAVREGQALHDKVVQKAIDTNPEGKVASYGTKRVGGSLAETARYQQRLRDVPAQLLEQASKRLGPTSGKLPGSAANRFQRVEQAALELTSVNTSPRLAAAYHLNQARKGVAPELNHAVAQLYKTVDQRGLLTKNANGDVIVNAADHPALAQADVQLAHVQGRGDEILTRYGVRSSEALKSAVDAPGKYRAGATYEKPSPGKQGLPTPGLKNAQKRIASLEGRVARSGAGGFRTVEVAQARLTKLEREHNAALDKVAGGLFGHIDQGEVNFRNRENKRAVQQASGVDSLGRASGASGAKATTRGTVKDQMRAEATKKIEQAIAANPDHPLAARWQARVNEIEQLHAALHPEIFEKVNRRDLGHIGTPTDPQRHAQLEGALAVAQRDLATAEKTAANRVTPTGVIGGETARPGRGHVSYAGSEPRAPKSAAASAASPVVGVAKAPITSHANEGVNISRGVVPADVTGQAARHYRQIVRFVNTTEHRNQAIRTGSDVRRSSRDVLVKVPGAEHAKIPAAINEMLGKAKVTHDDVAGINAALQAYKEDMVPGLRDHFAADKSDAIGTSAAEAAIKRGLATPEAPGGHVWVDRNILGDLAKPAAGPRGRIARTADTINSAVTAATVYFKIGHIGTRVLTNASTNIIQGSARPLEIGKSVKLFHAISEEDRLRALAASGQHGFSAMPHEGQNWVGRVAGVGANWWAKHADAVFRFNAVAYEARKAGFDTPAKFHDLLNRLERPQDFNMNAAEHAKVDWVAKRANRESIAYDRMSEGERRYLTRAVWFYPWLRGTFGFAANTMLEHPYKAGALAALGVQGRKTQEQQLGTLPSYEQGLMKLGGGARPLVADFSTFSPFATPADITEAVARPAELSGFLNPAATAGTNLIFGLNATGGKSKSPLLDAAASLASPTPEAQIITAFLHRHQNQNRRMFPKSSTLWGTRDPLLRALIGPGTPRRLNPSAAHRAAGREISGR